MNHARARAPLLSFARFIIKQQLGPERVLMTHREDITIASIRLVNAYLGITDWKPLSTVKDKA